MTELVYCNGCGHETEHTGEGYYEDKRPLKADDYEYGDEVRTSQLLVCKGCGASTLRKIITRPDEETAVIYYPPRRKRPFPDWLFDMLLHSDIDEAGRYFQVRDLLHEIYSAMAAEHFRLAAMGVRALIEFVIVDRVGDNGTFEKNLTALHVAGYISERQKRW